MQSCGFGSLILHRQTSLVVGDELMVFAKDGIAAFDTKAIGCRYRFKSLMISLAHEVTANLGSF